MSVAAEKGTLTVALVGNPNTGKSTLFTALAGVRQRIGNYPGVTVEKKIGHLHHASRRWALVDLPGTYSLAPRSLDEMVVVDVLLGRRSDVPACDVIICIVDASNLERNLYLVSQVLELGLPTVLALNMIDIAKARGLKIDAARLQQRLGIPVVPVQANKKRGLNELKTALAEAITARRQPAESPFPEPFRAEVANLELLINGKTNNGHTPAQLANVPRYLVERLLLDTSGYLEQSGAIDNGHLNGSLRDEVASARLRLAHVDCPVPAIEAIARYAWAGRMLEDVCIRQWKQPDTLTDRIDRVLTHRLWGTLVFAFVMFLLFSSIFIVAKPAMDWIAAGAQDVQDWVKGSMSEGAFRSLVVDGLIGGVGSVIVFLPQILLLFLFIAILEDCGYMARAPT